MDLEARQIATARPKDGRPLHLPTNSAALGALLRLKHMAGSSPYVILNRNARGRGVAEPARDPDGWFNGTLARAGLNGVCWHTLRHTFGSRAVMAGLDIRAVASLLGHRTLTMAMRYSHLAPRNTGCGLPNGWRRPFEPSEPALKPAPAILGRSKARRQHSLNH